MAKTKEKKNPSKNMKPQKTAKKKNKKAAIRGAVINSINEVNRQYRVSLGAALSALDIYPGQEHLLITLNEFGPLAPSHLADILAVKAPTVSKTVSRLSANGLVEKTKQDGDGRMVVIALTEAGKNVMAQLEKRKRQVEKELFSGLSKTEIAALGVLLEKMRPVTQPE